MPNNSLILDSNVLIKLLKKRHQKSMFDFLTLADEILHPLAVFVPNIVRYEMLRNEKDRQKLVDTINFLNEFHDLPIDNETVKIASYYWKILDKHKNNKNCPNPKSIDDCDIFIAGMCFQFKDTYLCTSNRKHFQSITFEEIKSTTIDKQEFYLLKPKRDFFRKENMKFT